MKKLYFVTFLLLAVGSDGLEVSQEQEAVQVTDVHNGTYVEIHQHPYLASIQIPRVKLCTGTIINEFFILTSAYCLAQAPDVASIKIRAGSTQRNSGGINLKPLKIIIHPLFENKWGSDFNLAIIILPIPMAFNPVVQPIKLPDECEHFDNDLTVAGWGPMISSGNYSINLKEYKQVKNDRASCEATYTSRRTFTARTFCATSVPKENVCKGHGMPVISNKNKLVGIYGWRSNCTQMSLPEIYTTIPAYRSWIRAVTGI